MKGLSPELAWPPQVGDLILIDCMYMWGENRHGNLGTYSRDGNGDTPLLYKRERSSKLRLYNTLLPVLAVLRLYLYTVHYLQII